MTKRIKNIIFDLGGVIMNIDTARTEEAFARMGALDFRKYFGHGFASSFFREYEKGEISDRHFIDELKKMTGLDLSDETVCQAWNALLLDFPPERIDLLKSLRRNYRIFLLSNTNALHLDHLRKIFRDAFGDELDNQFERAYYSHLMGMRKPDLESYGLVIRENQLIPGETLFVDDALINIEAARAAGLQGHFLKPGMDIRGLEWDSI
jgi:glucose-1-phosphatase